MRVTERDATATPDAREAPTGMAGALLRVARESAGMSIDMVAQQLKLAPRQVKALEDGDYTRLPGKTFVRGFVRNYARLVHLDPERVLGALPGGATAPALEAPTLTPTAQTMGELPTSDHSRTSWARWAIPSILATIVVAAAVYEWMRPAGDSRTAARQKETPASTTPAAAAPKPSADVSTSLPNPLAFNPPTEATPAPAMNAPSATASAPGNAPVLAPAANVATLPAAGAASVGEQTIVIAFRKSSWSDVRDRDGRVLLSGTHSAGSTQTVSGTPPFTIRIGNASDVALQYQGQPVDLAPFTQKNVARLTLP